MLILELPVMTKNSSKINFKCGYIDDYLSLPPESLVLNRLLFFQSLLYYTTKIAAKLFHFKSIILRINGQLGVHFKIIYFRPNKAAIQNN